MKLKLRKIDAILIVALIIVAGMVFFKVGYIPNPENPKPPRIEFEQDDVNNQLRVTFVEKDVLWKDINITGDCDKSLLSKYVNQGDVITDCRGTIVITYKSGYPYGSWTFKEVEKLPRSVTTGLRDISPKDEGPHYSKLLVNREWWYYTAVLSLGCDLPGWTISIGFNHMGKLDLKNPDILIATIQDPKGNTYGGMVERERPLLGILKEPSLVAEGSDKMFKVSFEKSYIQGLAPNWHVYINQKDLDEKNNIIIDLQYFTPNSGIWLFNSRILDKSDGNTGSYMFAGCEVTGTVEINGFTYNVDGIGHYEHTWTSALITKNLIRGWDLCNIKLNNGWNIYYNKYYILPQYKATTSTKINPFANIIITTDQGETVTILENVDVEILESDKLFVLLNIPEKMRITATAGATQIILNPYGITLDLNINTDNTYYNEWKFPSYIGTKIGRCSVSGSIKWTDDTDHDIDLEGIGTIWFMRH